MERESRSLATRLGRVVLLVVVGGWGLWGCEASGSPGVEEDDTDERTAVAGFELEAIDLSRTVRATASIETREGSRLRSRVDGDVKEVMVDIGDQVEVGQELVRLDRSEIEVEIAQVEAEKARLERRAERKRPLVDRDAITVAEVEDLEREQAVLERELDAWQTRLRRAQVVAPRAGTVTERYVEQGDDVSPGEELLALADMDTQVIVVRVSERDVLHLSEGDEVKVRVDALGDEWASAPIRLIHPEARSDGRRVELEIEMPDRFEGRGARPGFMARVKMSVDQRPDALAIPGESLLASTPGDRFVYVIDDGRLRKRSVEVGVERRNLREVTAGLDEGEVIVGTNPTNLSDGLKVKISEWTEAQ